MEMTIKKMMKKKDENRKYNNVYQLITKQRRGM